MKIPYHFAAALLPLSTSAARTFTVPGTQAVSQVTYTQVSVSTVVSSTPTSIVIDENVVAVYIFHRHGDRTAKIHPPANLTALGYNQVYNSGSYYRGRYVESNAMYKIQNINPDVVLESQLSVSAPSDTVLQNSAMGFMQALYPAGGEKVQETLRNGTTLLPPLNGYQLVPVGTVQGGGASEDTAWLQDTTDCGNAELSSQQYYQSSEYNSLYQSTTGFYQSWSPMINGSFNTSSTNFKNAYTIYDLVNVASIHNSTLNDDQLLTNLSQLKTLADQHEFNLAFNASAPIRGIAGMQLAAEVASSLNKSINSGGRKPAMAVQFGNYATMLSYFGLAGLAGVNGDAFHGVPDYASSLVWEVFYKGDIRDNPSLDDLFVRFLFHNGTATQDSPPDVFPLFGQTALNVTWMDFLSRTAEFSIGSTEQWCVACGNITGACSQYAGEVIGNGTLSPTASGSTGPGAAGNCGSGGGGGSSGNSISNAVAGVIGAMVTLGVIIIVELLVLCLYCCGYLGGWRSRRRQPARSYGGGLGYGGGISRPSGKAYGASLNSSAGLTKSGGAFAGFSEKDLESPTDDFDGGANGSLPAQRSFSATKRDVKRLPNGMAAATLGRGAASNVRKSTPSASARGIDSTVNSPPKASPSVVHSRSPDSTKLSSGQLGSSIANRATNSEATAADSSVLEQSAGSRRSKGSRRMPRTLRGPPSSRFLEGDEKNLVQRESTPDRGTEINSTKLLSSAASKADETNNTVSAGNTSSSTKYITKTFAAPIDADFSKYQVVDIPHESQASGRSAIQDGVLVQKGSSGSAYKVITPAETVETISKPSLFTSAAAIASTAKGAGDNDTGIESYQSYNTATGREQKYSVDSTNTGASYQSFDTVHGAGSGSGSGQATAFANGVQTHILHQTSGAPSSQYSINQVTDATNVSGGAMNQTSETAGQSGGSYSYATQDGDGIVTYITRTFSNGGEMSMANSGLQNMSQTWQVYDGGAMSEKVTKTIITHSSESQQEVSDGRDYGFGLHG